MMTWHVELTLCSFDFLRKAIHSQLYWDDLNQMDWNSIPHIYEKHFASAWLSLTLLKRRVRFRTKIAWFYQILIKPEVRWPSLNSICPEIPLNSTCMHSEKWETFESFLLEKSFIIKEVIMLINAKKFL